MPQLKGKYSVTPYGRCPDVDAFRFRSIPKARREAERLARWSGEFVYIVDQDAVDRGETRPYYGEIVAPPGKQPHEAPSSANEWPYPDEDPPDPL